MFTILFLLQLKHFIIDFPLQTPYQYLNKGKYGHPGGLIHSGLHGLGTALVFSFSGNLDLCVILGLTDFILHYHIDYIKVQCNQEYELTPTNSEHYWWLLGFDQFLHQLSYLYIVWLIRDMV